MAGRSLAPAQKKAKAGGYVIVFIDEAGFYLVSALVRTYAPRGQTPILRSVFSYDHLSVMSGITLHGQLYTLIRDRALTSWDSVRFLKHLCRKIQSKIWVVWDGSPIHRREVTRFMTNGGSERIHLESLPSYAPELNPDEGVWQYLKNVELRNVHCKDLKELRRELQLAILRLRNRPSLIQSFFGGADLTLD